MTARRRKLSPRPTLARLLVNKLPVSFEPIRELPLGKRVFVDRTLCFGQIEVSSEVGGTARRFSDLPFNDGRIELNVGQICP